MEQTEKTIWTWLNKEVWLIGIVIAGVLWITTQLNVLDKNQALIGQKLDTLIAWSKQHDDETVIMKQNLNLTFSDIYLKLGEHYVPKVSQQ